MAFSVNQMIELSSPKKQIWTTEETDTALENQALTKDGLHAAESIE